MSVSGQQVAEQAKKLKPGIFGLGTISYVNGGEDPKTGLDCQGLVEYCHNQCGMKMSFKGTNDMWRNMLSEKGTIEEGVKRHGSIPVGALIFICDYNLVPNGYSDTPDCEHVYIKTAKGELVHASAGNGKVTTRDFADKAIPNGGPTHYGLVKGVEYDGVTVTETQETTAVAPAVEAMWAPRYDHLVFKYGKKKNGDLLCAGSGVEEIQFTLRALGYGAMVNGQLELLKVDREFGPKTDEAVRSFQKDEGLDVDGVVGKDTWTALIDAVNA